MGWSLGEKGSGARRDLVVIAHGGVTEAIRAAAPGAAVVGVTFPPMKGHYAGIGPDKLPPLGELVRGALQQAGAAELGRLVLVGFSEGCQAVRAWLAAGEVPSAAIAIDGIHGTKPAPSVGQVAPWRAFFSRSRAGERFGAVTATRIPTVTYLPTASMLPIVTGFPPAPLLDKGGGSVAGIEGSPRDACAVLLSLGRAQAGDLGASLVLGALVQAAVSEYDASAARSGDDGAWMLMPAWSGTSYQRAQQGALVAEQWPGTDGPAHVQQAQQVMPRLIGEALQRQAIPWVSGYSTGPRPPEPSGVVWPAIPGVVPGGGGGGGGGGRPPAPGAAPPPPAPPPPSDDSAAAGAVLVLGLGVAGLALSRRG